MFSIQATPEKMIGYLKLMSLPGKGDSLFPTVAPTFYPEGKMILHCQNRGSAQLNEFRQLMISGIEEPTQFVIPVAKFISHLSLFSSTEEIIMSYDYSKEQWTLKKASGEGRSVNIPGLSTDGVFMDGPLPMVLSEDGLPIWKNGAIPTNVRADLNVDVFTTQIKTADIVDPDPRIFFFKIMKDNKIVTIVGDENKRSKDRVVDPVDILVSEWTGQGQPQGDTLCECSYAKGFEEVINNLEGVIELRLVSGAPMFIRQETEEYTVRYTIAPAVV